MLDCYFISDKVNVFMRVLIILPASTCLQELETCANCDLLQNGTCDKIPQIKVDIVNIVKLGVQLEV